MVGGNEFEPMTSAMYTSKHLDLYLDSLNLKGLSQNYIFKIRQYLLPFVNTCEHLSPESAETHLSNSAHLKANTRARYATYLKGFLNYLGIPFDMKVKVPKTLPPYVEGSEIALIVDWIKSKKSHKQSIERDLILLETAKKTGMRRSELANLKVGDVNLDKSRIYVRGGKGDRDRVIPVHLDLVETLSTLIEGRTNGERVFFWSQTS